MLEILLRIVHGNSHLKRRPAIVKPDEVFDYYELDAADLQEDTDHEEHFTQEKYYAAGDNVVYYYDPLGDAWLLLGAG